MKTSITIEYDGEDVDDRRVTEGMLKASEAWYALWEISQLIAVYRKNEGKDIDALLVNIQDEIDATRLEKVWI